MGEACDAGFRERSWVTKLQATAQIVETLQLSRQINNKWAMTMALNRLENIAFEPGSLTLTARLLAAIDGCSLAPEYACGRQTRRVETKMTAVQTQLYAVSFQAAWGLVMHTAWNS